MTADVKPLSELSRLVGGTVVGDDQVEIARVAAIEEAGPGEITFLAHPRYQAYLARSTASAIIVGPGIAREVDPGGGRSYLEVPDPYLAFAKILQIFSPTREHDGKISALASIDPSATLGKGVTVFPNVFIGKGVEVRQSCVLYPGVFLGRKSRWGRSAFSIQTLRSGRGVALGTA